MPQHKLALLSALAPLATSQINYTTDPDLCYNPQGYKECISNLNDNLASCILNAGPTETLKVLACNAAAESVSLDCIYEECWNVVYSCEVQSLAVLIALDDGGNNLPYYPAPDDAPGRCSCNLEAVQIVVTGSLGLLNKCTEGVSKPDVIDACTCCAQAGAYAGIFEICPSVDPQLLLDVLPGTKSLLQGYSPQFEQCIPTLNQIHCRNDLGYPNLGFDIDYLSTVPLEAGTGSYSNLPGMLSTSTALSYSAASSLQVTTASDGEAGSSSKPATTPSGVDESNKDQKATESAGSNEEESGQSTISATNSAAAATGESSGSTSATPSRANGGFEKSVGFSLLCVCGFAWYMVA